MVKEWIKRERHEVEAVGNGQDALAYLGASAYDLVILDLGLPGLNGFEILQWVRNQKNPVPVLILTGQNQIEDKERGLESGADDYLTKPFDIRELLARVKALLRRPRMFLPDVLRCRDVEIDANRHSVTKSGKPIQLTPREYSLLEFLMRHPDQVFSTEALLERVWRSESEATEEAIVACIARLRKKIDGGGKDSMIGTVYGAGYLLKTDGQKG